MITMKNWREKMDEDMRLRDLRPRTIGAYLLAVRLFFDRVGKTPEEAGEQDVRRYILHLRDERKQSPSTVNIAICALRFFFSHTLPRDYEVFDLMRVNRPRTLPTVLSRQEVRRVLGVVRHPVRRVALTSIYALGLRLGEGLRLPITSIQADRHVVMVKNAKGGKDRAVPLPQPLLRRLRHYRPSASFGATGAAAHGEQSEGPGADSSKHEGVHAPSTGSTSDSNRNHALGSPRPTRARAARNQARAQAPVAERPRPGEPPRDPENSFEWHDLDHRTSFPMSITGLPNGWRSPARSRAKRGPRQVQRPSSAAFSRRRLLRRVHVYTQLQPGLANLVLQSQPHELCLMLAKSLREPRRPFQTDRPPAMLDVTQM